MLDFVLMALCLAVGYLLGYVDGRDRALKKAARTVRRMSGRIEDAGSGR